VVAGAVSAVAVAAFGGTNDTVIGFDTLAPGAVVTDQYRGLGVVFEGHWEVAGPGAFTNAVTPPNSVAYFDPTNQGANYTVAANFVVPGTSVQAGVHVVSFTPTDASNANTLCTIRGYNAAGFEVANNNRLIGAEGTYDPQVDVPLEIVATGNDTIVRVELTVALSMPGNRVIEGDNFRFGPLVIPPCGPADVGSIGATPGPDHVLDNNDFIVYVDMFFAHDPAADRGSTGGEPGSDGMWDNNDFVVFIDQFFTGC